MDKTNEIRGLMIAVTNGRVLLPNANVTEIITYSTPEPIDNAPAWLLGRTRWRGWRGLAAGIGGWRGAIAPLFLVAALSIWLLAGGCCPAPESAAAKTSTHG